MNIWVDWNNDTDFANAGELVYAGGTYLASATGSIAVPAGQPLGNYRLRIRADYLNTNPSACGNIAFGEAEDYTLTVVTPPPCSGIPSNLSANVTGLGSVTLSWNAAAPIPASGYLYYVSTSPASPSFATSATGSTAAGVLSVSLSGLTIGTTYYFWVRSNCGVTGNGLWAGPYSFFLPTCTVGNSLGTTTLGCPNVLSGGLGLSGSDPAPVDCKAAECVDLEATYLQLGQTTAYSVESIPYAPPYQFGCLKNPVSVDQDDIWSPVVSLPFNFCFYGNTYNSCLISSNGVITFDQINNIPGGSSTWSFNTNLPSNTLFLNSISGVYHDIDPSIGGEVGWELITLNTGCRALVASWNDIPMYSVACNAQLYSGMIVLYENTNSIEIYIEDNQPGWYWYQAPVEAQALAIEAFREISGDKKSADAMKVWLIKNKQTQSWPTTKATTEAVYALLNQGSGWISVKDKTVFRIGDEKIVSQKLGENQKEAESGYVKLQWKPEEISPEMASVSSENKSDVPAFGGIFWQYFENLDQIKSGGNAALSVQKKLLVAFDGKSMEIKPDTKLKVGDLVTVQLIVEAKEDFDFVHLKDLRAAAFEPVDVLSGYQYQNRIGFYKSTRDAATHYFFDSVQKGIYVLEYQVRVNNRGDFSNGITTIESMYAPEFSAHTKGIRVQVD